MGNKNPRKIDWNLVLTGISTIAAVLSVLSALTANRIAQESQSPKVSVNYVGQFRDYYDDYKAPCKNQLGYGDWKLEFVLMFDISNLGGKAISLVDINSKREVETFHPQIQADVFYDFFGTNEKLNKWLQEHSAPSFVWLERSKEKLDYSGPPINVGAGETRRIVLLGRENVRIDSSLSPQQTLQALYDINWNSNIAFKFADNSVVQQSIRLIHPFAFQVSKSTPLVEFPACPPP